MAPMLSFYTAAAAAGMRSCTAMSFLPLNTVRVPAYPRTHVSTISPKRVRVPVSPRAEYLGVFGSGPAPSPAGRPYQPPPPPSAPRRPVAPPPFRSSSSNPAKLLLGLTAAVAIPVVLSAFVVSTLTPQVIDDVLQLDEFPSTKIPSGIRERLEIIVSLVKSSPDLLATAWVAAHGLAGIASWIVFCAGGWKQQGAALRTYQAMLLLSNAWVLALSKLRLVSVSAVVKAVHFLFGLSVATAFFSVNPVAGILMLPLLALSAMASALLLGAAWQRWSEETADLGGWGEDSAGLSAYGTATTAGPVDGSYPGAGDDESEYKGIGLGRLNIFGRGKKEPEEESAFIWSAVRSNENERQEK